MSKHWDTDSAGNYVTVIEEFTTDHYGHDTTMEIFRGTKIELDSSTLPMAVKVKAFDLDCGQMSDSTHRYRKEAYSDHLHHLELDSLALASSRNKQNKVAESLAYDSGAIVHAICQMNNVVRNADQAGAMSRALKEPYSKQCHEHDYITTLMGHAEGPSARAAVATAYHNMKTCENRLN